MTEIERQLLKEASRQLDLEMTLKRKMRSWFPLCEGLVTLFEMPHEGDTYRIHPKSLEII
jgi:hypothetical protein